MFFILNDDNSVLGVERLGYREKTMAINTYRK